MIWLHLASAILSILLAAVVLARRKERRRTGPSAVSGADCWSSPLLLLYFVRGGNVAAHKRFMIGTCVGLAGTGLGALAPGRTLYLFFFA